MTSLVEAHVETVRRIQYHQYGGPDVMRLEDYRLPGPGEGQVLVRVHAAAANPMDWKIRNGEMKMMTGRKFPRGLGHDFSGVVEAVGEGVSRLRIGDAVLGGASIKAAGAFAEMVVADERALVSKPSGLSYAQAAALPIVGLTALQAMTGKGGLHRGQAVFIHGCLGGVGRAAAQIAVMRGASVTGSCRPTAHHDAADLGIVSVVDFEFDPAPFKERFDIVLDTAGTLPIAAARTMVKAGGRIIDINPTAAKLARSVLPGPFEVLIAKVNAGNLEEIARDADRGALLVPIARSVPLTAAIQALTELETEHTPKGGKVVITIQ